MKSKFIHILSESKNIFALEQKAVVLSFVKNVAFLLGHPVDVATLAIEFCNIVVHIVVMIEFSSAEKTSSQIVLGMNF